MWTSLLGKQVADERTRRNGIDGEETSVAGLAKPGS
jgi:hypothetical protein